MKKVKKDPRVINVGILGFVLKSYTESRKTCPKSKSQSGILGFSKSQNPNAWDLFGIL